MLAPQAGEYGVGGVDGEQRHRLALHEQAKLEGLADQVDVDMGDLHAALRDGRQKPLGLEARHDLTDGAKRQPGKGNQFALRHELSRPEIAGQQMPREAGISSFPEGCRFAAVVHFSALPFAGQAGSVANSLS